MLLIPTGGEDLFCLARVVALYREGDATIILRVDGTRGVTSLTPRTLKKRGEALWASSALDKPIVNFTEELHIDG